MRSGGQRGGKIEKGRRLWCFGDVAMEKRREKKRGPATLSARKTAQLISPENKLRRYDGFTREDKVEAERCEVAMVRVCSVW
ncbi:hypothetical protein HAX54_005641 [Datura stramonium]|uniref:Uncharacterized protein n=1 Tax=Datura stramonium TaxID=4076 RepID=A0ABS8WVY8_DATST|nr:hypothetical protein [Datura stramonium]